MWQHFIFIWSAFSVGGMWVVGFVKGIGSRVCFCVDWLHFEAVMQLLNGTKLNLLQEWKGRGMRVYRRDRRQETCVWPVVELVSSLVHRHNVCQQNVLSPWLCSSHDIEIAFRRINLIREPFYRKHCRQCDGPCLVLTPAPCRRGTVAWNDESLDFVSWLTYCGTCSGSRPRR